MKFKFLLPLIVASLLLGCKNEVSVNYDLTDEQRIEILDLIDETLGNKSLVYNFKNEHMYYSVRGIIWPKEIFEEELPDANLINEFTFKKSKIEYKDNDRTYAGLNFSAELYADNYAMLDEIVINDDCVVESLKMQIIRFPESVTTIPYIEGIVLKNVNGIEDDRPNAGSIHTSYKYYEKTIYYSEWITPKSEAVKALHNKLFDGLSAIAKNHCTSKAK